MGFTFGERTPGAVRLSGLPAVVPEGLAVALLKDLLEQEAANPEQASFSEAEFLSRKMSRKLAVPPGVKLEKEASTALLRDLLLCKESQFSPYGKLIYIRVTSEEMDKKFK
jgi:DNA mismatch repair protein MutL